MQYQKNGKMRRKVQKKKNSRHNRLVSTSLANKWCLDSVHCSHLERSPVLTHTQKKWIKEKQSHVEEAAGSSHLPPLGRLCQQEGNTSSSGNQHFMWTAQFPAIKPPDQPSHFWAAQHFSLWPRPKASLYPENSYEEDYTNFPWLFFSGLETKAISKHSATYGEYVWVNAQAFL